MSTSSMCSSALTLIPPSTSICSRRGCGNSTSQTIRSVLILIAFINNAEDLPLTYLGLIHHTDGIARCLRRVVTARKYVSGFGVATEGGLSRRPPETIPELLRIHREVAAVLEKQ